MIGQNISFFADGNNLACALKSFTPTAETEQLDNTTLCSNGFRTFEPGFQKGTISAEGVWDADTTNQNKIDDVMKAAFGNKSTQVVTASLDLIAIGGVALLAKNSKVSKYDVKAELGQLIMCSVDLQTDNAVEFGKWLFNGTDTGAGTNGTSVDNGAASTGGGILHGHLYTQSDSAATAANFKIQHSTDNSTWVDLANGSVSANKGAIMIEVAKGTTIYRYIRIVFTSTTGKGYGVAAFARR